MWTSDKSCTRDPELAAVLSRCTPAAGHEATWSWQGTPLPLRISSYLGPIEVPLRLVTSVRCLVAVHESLVVCETPRDIHVWPGGHREPGESVHETAIREVREETGWMITPDELVPLGFLLFEELVAPPADYPYPTPDFLQLVFGARVTNPDDDPPDRWTDSEGWERTSYLANRARLRELPLTPPESSFITAFLG